jgi:hypothetical protein
LGWIQQSAHPRLQKIPLATRVLQHQNLVGCQSPVILNFIPFANCINVSKLQHTPHSPTTHFGTYAYCAYLYHSMLSYASAIAELQCIGKTGLKRWNRSQLIVIRPVDEVSIPPLNRVESYSAQSIIGHSKINDGPLSQRYRLIITV